MCVLHAATRPGGTRVKTNICLVGFMGTGKTRAGRIVAELMGKQFVETDAMIEAAASKPITRIFNEDGEIRFRELEIAVIKQAASMENAVFSLGGGAVLNTINMLYMQRSSVVICLVARPAVLLQRLVHEEREKRPLLAKPDPAREIERLLAIRAPFYAAATDLVIDTSMLSIEDVASKIIAFFNSWKDK
ncbi:MAG: shikimate kinase [Candidatus Lokiarchaeota archaeon]|nr:shikimate kinase [Candidatus Lokiarchaeota archaeon]